MEKMYRQGDILIIETYSINGHLDNSNVLIEGSITGHSHKITNGKIYKMPINFSGDFASIEASNGCRLMHEEHKEIELPKGIYKARRQREVVGFVKD